MQKLVVKRDVREKPGYQPYGTKGTPQENWQKDLVAIRVPRFDNDGEPPIVYAGVRGTAYRIPRGRNVKVPRAIADVVRQTIQMQWAIGAPGREMAGLRPLGKTVRFHVIELSGKEADAATVLEPAKPMGASELALLAKQAAAAAAEDAQARAEIASAPVRPELMRQGVDAE